MTDERWEQIKEMVNKDFQDVENTISDLPEEQGSGTKETLIFEGPLGKMKLEYYVKALVLGKKTHFSKRAGQQTKVDYVTSETEKVRTMLAFKWEDSTQYWVEMDAATFE